MKKIIIYLLIFFTLVSIANSTSWSNFTTDLWTYLPCDTAVTENKISAIAVTNYNTTRDLVNFKNGAASCNFTYLDAKYMRLDLLGNYTKNKMAYAFWYRQVSTYVGQFGLFAAYDNTSTSYLSKFIDFAARKPYVYNANADDTGANYKLSPTALTLNDWHLIVVNLDTGGEILSFYADNTAITSPVSTGSYSYITNNAFVVGSAGNGRNKGQGTYWDGQVDEFMVWNRTLTAAEIGYLWNGGAGLFYSNFTGDTPTASLILNNGNLSSGNYNKNISFNFNGTMTNTGDIFNCTMYWNSTTNGTKTDVNLTINQYFNLTYSGSQVGYDINVTCQNNNATGSFKVANVLLDSVTPTISMKANFANNSIRYANQSTEVIDFNVTFADGSLNIANVTLWYLNPNSNTRKAVMNNTVASSIGKTSYIINYTRDRAINLTAMEVFNLTRYEIEMTAYDSGTLNMKTMSWFFNYSQPVVANLSLSTDLIDNFNSSNYPFQFWFNGTATNTVDNNYNCTFYSNTTVVKSMLNVNVTRNNQFNFTGGAGDYRFNVTCFNTNTTDSFSRNGTIGGPTAIVTGTPLVLPLVAYLNDTLQMYCNHTEGFDAAAYGPVIYNWTVFKDTVSILSGQNTTSVNTGIKAATISGLTKASDYKISCQAYTALYFGNLSNTTRTISAFPTTITNLAFDSTGGQTPFYFQSLTAVSFTPSNIVENISSSYFTVYKPSGAVAQNTSGTSWTGALLLDEVGAWIINATSYSAATPQGVGSQKITITVGQQAIPSMVEGYYGFMLSQNNVTFPKIDFLLQYGYNLFGFEVNYSNWNTNWQNAINAINYTYMIHNKVSFVKLNFDTADYSNPTQVCIDIDSVTNLTRYPYIDGTIFVAIEQKLTDANYISFTNAIATCIRTKTNNKFPIYSTNNFAGMDSNYISAVMIPIVSINLNISDWIKFELDTAKSNTSKSRIYYEGGGAYVRYSDIQDYNENVIRNLRAGFTGTTTGTDIFAYLTNGDYVAFNYENSVKTTSGYDAAKGHLAKDFYDFTDKVLYANASSTTVPSLNTSAQSIRYIVADTVGKLFMTSNATGTIFTTTGNVLRDMNYTLNGTDATFSIVGAYDTMIELWNPDSGFNSLFFATYEQLAYTYNTRFENYSVIVIAGGANTPAIVNQSLRPTVNIEILNKTYGYISVADYNNLNISGLDETDCTKNNSWEDMKIAQAYNWTDLYLANVFIDGFDIGYSVTPNCFNERIKRIADGIHINKRKKVIFNSYTIYQQIANYGDYVMRESCFSRWDGVVGTPTYSYEDFSLMLLNAEYLSINNKPVLCMAFGDADDYDKMAYDYHAFAVLYGADGSNVFRYGQPNFQTQREIRVPDFGDLLQLGWTNNSINDLSRRYEFGIVHFDPTRTVPFVNGKYFWFDDGKTINSLKLKVKAQVYAATCAGGTGIAIQMYNASGYIGSTYDIDPCTDIGAAQWTANTVTKDITAEYSENGHYFITFRPISRAEATGTNLWQFGETQYGVHSFWDNTASNPPIPTSAWTAYGRSGVSGSFDTVNFYAALFLNKTASVALDQNFDTVQTITFGGVNKTIMFNSSYSFKKPVWSIPIFYSGILQFTNLSYLSGGAQYLLNMTNTTTCDENNPIFASTVILGKTHQACYEQNSSGLTIRIAAPELSTQIYLLGVISFTLGNLEIAGDLTPRSIDSLDCNFTLVNVTAPTTDVRVTWYKSINNKTTWTIDNTYSGVMYHIIFGTPYVTSLANGRYQAPLQNYTDYKCRINATNADTEAVFDSDPVSVYPLENLTQYSPADGLYSHHPLSVNFSVIDWNEGINCNLSINNTVQDTSLCFQETATTATSCGGVNTGAYADSGNWDVNSRLNDEDYTLSVKKSGACAAPAEFYINYTKPTYAIDAIWYMRDHPNGYHNMSIPAVCWSYSSTTINLQVVDYNENLCFWAWIQYKCWNGTGWHMIENLRDDGGTWFYEEAIWWVIRNTGVSSGVPKLLNYTPSVSGNYSYYLQCSANNETITSSSRNFLYDISPPTFGVFSNNSTSVSPEIGGSVELNLTAYDNFLLDTCYLEMNDTGVWENKTSVHVNAFTSQYLRFNYTINSNSTYARRNVLWRIICYDEAGNEGISEIQAFLVRDRTVPTIFAMQSGTSYNLNNLSVVSGLLYNVTSKFNVTDYNLNIFNISVDCVDDGNIFSFQNSSMTLDVFYADISKIIDLTGHALQRCDVNATAIDAYTRVSSIKNSFYIGGAINLSTIERYANTSFNIFNATITTVSSYPGLNTTYVVAGNTDWLENVSEGNYSIAFVSPYYLPQTYSYLVENVSQRLAYDTSQGLVNFRVRNVKTTSFLTNFTLYVNNTNTSEYRVYSSGDTGSLITMPLNAGEFTVIIERGGYVNATTTFSLEYRETLNITYDISFIANFILLKEEDGTPFNISVPTKVEFFLFCPNSTIVTVINESTKEIPITCDYRKFVFFLTYVGGTYYRSFIITAVEATNYSVYLFDASITSYVSNNFIVDDLQGDYDNPSIWVYKYVGANYVQITSDYVELESKIVAYLMTNTEYKIELHADNYPTRIMGNYIPTASGDKSLRLYDVGVPDVANTEDNGVSKAVYFQNISGVPTVKGIYTDPTNKTTSVRFRVLRQTSGNNFVEIYSAISTDNNANFDFDATNETNGTLKGVLDTTYDGTVKPYSRIVNVVNNAASTLIAYTSPDFRSWFFLLLFSFIALAATLATGDLAALIITGLAGIFMFFKLFQLTPIKSGVIIGLAIIALISLLMTGRRAKGV